MKRKKEKERNSYIGNGTKNFFFFNYFVGKKFKKLPCQTNLLFIIKLSPRGDGET